MDLDSFVLEHSSDWDRLSELGRQPRLTGPEADELVDLYQRVGTHVAIVRSNHFDPVLEARLSSLVATARGTVTGTSPALLQTVGRFFAADFPAAAYRARWWWLVTSVLSVGVAVWVMFRMLSVPGLAESMISDEAAKKLVDYEFAEYYTENPASDFALQVFLNNALVAAICLVSGIIVIPVIALLYQTMVNVGLIWALMLDAGRGDVFYGMLLPHGMLELTIIFLAAGASLRLAWAWMAPGPRTRSQALATEGRVVGAIAIGAAAWLLISGCLEGFVTPSTLPAWARLTIGGVVWASFVTYVLVLGRRAVAAGHTGDIDRTARSAEAPTEAAV
ncbi:stage II sporulation protein M [Propionibacteriaceae bacterium Y1685]|uniref:stage II sporulation protein M n=1 Tax=Microlunatus sp. Y1700 TaxID=3418487 RepID=UPI003B81AA68